MIKIIPLELLDIGLIINLVISQFKRSRHPDTEQRTQYDQQPDFFVEIQNGMLAQFNIFAGMRIFLFQLAWMFSLCGTVKCQFKTDSLLEKILLSDSDSILQKLIQQPDAYRVQIIYT